MAEKTLSDLLLEGESTTPDVFKTEGQLLTEQREKVNLADYLLTNKEPQLQLGTIPETDVTRVPFKDADTFFGNMGLSMDQAHRESFDMLRILGKRTGFETLEKLGIEGVIRNEEEIAQYKPKEESASLEQNIDNIIDAYGEEGFLAAMGEMGEGLVQMSSAAVGSMVMPLTGAAAAATAAATLPVTGISAGVAATVGAVLTAMPQAGGAVYNEAKQLGASEEDAENAAMIAAPIIAGVEAVTPARLISSAVKKMGKDAVVDATAKHVGKVAARSAVERSLDLTKAAGKTIKEAGKSGLRVGLQESLTELTQEKIQLSAAGLAAGKGTSPYEGDEEMWRLLDAGALGFVGGNTMGAAGSIVTQYEARAARQEAELVKEADKNVYANNDTFNQQATEYTTQPQNGVLRSVRDAMARSTSLLDRAAQKYPESVGRVKNAFDTYTDYVNKDFAGFATEITDAFKPLYRGVKLPFASPVSTQDQEAVFNYIYSIEGKYTPEQIKVAESLKPILGQKTHNRIALGRKDVSKFLKNPEEFKTFLETEGTNLSEADRNKHIQSFNSFQEELKTQTEKLVKDGIKPKRAQSMAFKELTSNKRKKGSVHYRALTDTPIQLAEGTGLYGELLKANQNIDFVENFLPVRLKFKSKANRQAMKNILVDNYGWEPSKADDFVEGVRQSGGFPNEEIKLYQPQATKDIKSQSEKKRTLTDAIRDDFVKAGLVDKNLMGILYEYALDTTRRKNLADVKDKIDALKTAPDGNTLLPYEKDRIVNLFNALQGSYKNIDPDLRSALSGLQFMGYVVTMPFAALSAIAEPAILLYTYGPKHVIPATFGAIYRTGRKGIREIFPKLALSEQEKYIRNTAQGWDEAMTDRLNEIEQIGLGRKLTNAFFKATLLTQLTQLSRDIAATAGRRALREDIQTVFNARDRGETTRASTAAQRRLNKAGLRNIFYPENKKMLEEWAAGKYTPETEPKLMKLVQSKIINDAIMAPDATKKPLWMSNPLLAPVAQLKSFMFVFGNTVGYKMWTDLYKPLVKQGRFPADVAFRAAMALGTIMALSAFAQMLRDQLRYGDEDSPYDDMDENEKLVYLLNRTAIGGPFQLIWDGFYGASKYGGTPMEAAAGPVATKLFDLGLELSKFIGDGNARGLSREVIGLLPGIGAVSMENEIKADLVDRLEEFSEDIVGRKHGGKVVQRADGGKIAEATKEPNIDMDLTSVENQFRDMKGLEVRPEGLNMPSADINTIAYLESRGKPDAINKVSGATGLFQITPSTAEWLEHDPTKLLDPEYNKQVFLDYASKNAESLGKYLDRPVEPFDIYMTHQQGMRGYLQLNQFKDRKIGNIKNKDIKRNVLNNMLPKTKKRKNPSIEDWINDWKDHYESVKNDIILKDQ